MTFPRPPKPAKLTRLSPSTYEAARRCNARAAWLAFGDRDALPGSPAAILGLCFHKVAAAAQAGRLQTVDGVESSARSLFDEAAEEIFAKSHEAFKVKFGVKERLPGYYLRREESVALARTLSPDEPLPPSRRRPSQMSPTKGIEQNLQSKDGLLYGRPDLIDTVAGEVVDYKTRRESLDGPNEVTDQEMRQLRLYALLATDNGTRIQRGVIVLADGRRLTVELKVEDVQHEARSAAAVLESYNAAIDGTRTFEEIASPSVENCRYCPCMVLCEAFWKRAQPSWQEHVGTQVQGKLTSISKASVQGVNLLTLHLECVGGTIEKSKVVLEQVPEEWLLGEVKAPPSHVVLVRIINAHAAVSMPEHTVLRVDRAATETWILNS
ncbi:MAG TPA: PD-(D/E)XK nuclease family protein [Pyrinomonadaceae bacterium]